MGRGILHEPEAPSAGFVTLWKRANCTCFQMPSRLLLDGARCHTIEPVIVRIRSVHGDLDLEVDAIRTAG